MGQGQGTRAAWVLFMEVSLCNKVGVILATAVWADVSLAIGAGMVVAALADLGVARILLAVGAPRMMEHPLRQLLLLGQRGLTCRLITLRAVWIPPVTT